MQIWAIYHSYRVDLSISQTFTFFFYFSILFLYNMAKLTRFQFSILVRFQFFSLSNFSLLDGMIYPSVFACVLRTTRYLIVKRENLKTF